MSNMTFLCVNTIQLGPQCKNCFLRHHFRRKSGSQRATSSFLMWQQIFFFPNALRSQRHVLGQRAILSHTCSTLFVTFPNERARKWVKEWREDNFRKEWMKALKKNADFTPRTFSPFHFYLQMFREPKQSSEVDKILGEYTQCIRRCDGEKAEPGKLNG